MPAVAAFITGAFSFGAGAGAAFAGGAATFGAWTAGAAFASTIVGGLTVKLLTTVAISALTSALTHEPPQGGGITISTTVRGEQNPETIVVGRYATAGQAIAAPYSHGKSNRYLTHVVELCSAPGAQLSRVMIGDEWVELGPATPDPLRAHDYGRPVLGDHEGHVWVKYHDGTQTAADPYLRAAYGAHPDRPWTEDMVGHGICYAILTFCFDSKGDHQLTQVPKYRFELQGIPLYDIRQDSTAGGSGAQRLDNPATWAPTENPAVIAWNIMRGIPLPGGEVYGGGISDLSELPKQMWVTAMNRCDAAIEIAGGGTEPQYRAGLEIALDQPPAAALEEIFKACSATIADLGYGWGIVVGAPALPVYSFTDEDVIVTKPQEYDPFPGIEATYNAVSARYPEPDELYETKEAPQRTNAGWEAADVFGRRMAKLSLPAVTYKRQVQRLMRAWIEDERRFRRHNLSLPPDSAVVEPTDTVSWTSTRNVYATKSFSVHKIVEDPRTGIRTMSLRERDPADYAWVPGDELPSTPTDPGTTDPDPETVSGFSVQAFVLRDAAGLARRPGLMLGWDDDLLAQGLQWQVRLAGETGLYLSGSMLDIDTGALRLVEGILPATTYQARAKLISRWGTAWTPWLSATTASIGLTPDDFDRDPPDVPTGLTLTSSPGVLAATWTMSTAGDLAYYDIELTEAGGNPVAFQTPQAAYVWRGVLPDTQFSARVRAVDRLGNRSNWSASVSHTVARDTTPPAVPTGISVTAGFGTLWLKWTPNTEADLAGYEIYQSSTTTAPAAATVPTYVTAANTVAVTGLAEAVTRYFWVRATDTSGNKSAWSARYSGTTSSIWQPPGTPAVPTGLATSSRLAGVTSYVRASWAAATGAVAYELGITEAGQTEMVIPIGDLFYEWQALPLTVFSIRVRAVSATGLRSAWSAVVSQTAMRDTVAPAVPANPATTSTFGAIWVKWDRSAEADMAYYEVLWNSSASWTPPPNPGTPPTQIISNEIVITGLGAGQTRYIAIRAVDTSGNKSAWTTPIPGSTLADVDFEITTADLVGLIDATSFANAIEPVTIHTGPSLPTVKSTSTLMWNGKLYRWSNGTYVANTEASDIIGQLVAGQLGVDAVQAGNIGAGAVNTRELAAGAVTASKMLVMDTTNLVPDPSFLDAPTWASTRVSISTDLSTAPAGVNASRFLLLNPAAGAWYATPPGTEFIVAEGQKFLFTAKTWRNSGTDGTIRIRAVFLDKNGVAIAGAPQSIGDTTGALFSHTLNVTAPAGAVRARFGIYVNGGANSDWGLIEPSVMRRMTGELIVDGTLKSNHFVTNEAVITGTAQIANAIIGDAHITEMSAAKLKAGSSITGSLLVDGATALSALSAGIQNFNANNDRISLSPTAPTHSTSAATVLSYTANTDGSVDIRYQWNYTVTAGTASDIDGFIVFVRASTSSAAYTVTGTAADETPIYVTKDKRSVVLTGVSADKYYTFAVRAYRAVDSDINANGVLMSAIVKPTIAGTNPYRPAANVEFSGNLAGTPASTVVSNAALGAQDPATRINQGTTDILPGRITINGPAGTRLSNWIGGTNNTEIDGAAIAANTIAANKATIGMRGVSPTNIQFEANADGVKNRLRWNSGVKAGSAFDNTGTIAYVSDAGLALTATITSGQASWTSGTLYIYWTQGAATLSATTNAATARATNNVILATYKGDLALNADYGRTVIDGDEIRTGTIRGVHMITTENIITEQAQIGNATVRNAAIVELDAGKLIAGSTLSGSIRVDGRALAVMGGAQLLDTMADDWIKVAGSGTMEMIGAGSEVTPGARVLRAMEGFGFRARSPHRSPFDPRKLYKLTYSIRRMTAIAGTKGNFMAGVLGMDADGNAVAYEWPLTVDQATVPWSYTDYAVYIKGAQETPSGAGTIASPRSMGIDTRFLCPSVSFNQVYGTNDGDYRMLLGVASIEIVNEDAGELVNAGSTNIDPGRIRVSGGSTLADWRKGGDETRINGGMISANTIKANALEIGSRNLTLTGIQFEHDSPGPNQVSWTAGQVRYVNDAGTTTSAGVSADSATWTSGVLYIYWAKGATRLSTTTTQTVAFDDNNVILATYQGGKRLDPDYGRTVIDGSDIKTGTLTADRVDSTSFYNAGLSVFGGTLASDNFSLANGTGWRITRAGVMNMPNAVVDTLQLKDGAVSTMWSANANSLTISASYPMRLLVLTNIRVAGVSNVYSANGYIRRNGVDVESSSYSVGIYSWMLTMFKTVDVASGNHTFSHTYTGNAADYSQPRIAIFGAYK